MDLRASLLLLVATPDRALLTLLIGVLLVYRELMRPGRVLPGVLGAVAVVNALVAMADYRITFGGVALVALGLGLVVAQGWVDRVWAPGIVGVIVLFWGVYYVFAPPYRVSLAAALAVLPFGGITAFLLRTAVRGRQNKLSGRQFRLR